VIEHPLRALPPVYGLISEEQNFMRASDDHDFFAIHKHASKIIFTDLLILNLSGIGSIDNECISLSEERVYQVISWGIVRLPREVLL